MVSTRSKSAQTPLEDYATKERTAKGTAKTDETPLKGKGRPRKSALPRSVVVQHHGKIPTSSKKRRSTESAYQEPESKRTKPSTTPTNKEAKPPNTNIKNEKEARVAVKDDQGEEDAVIINRAPVLHLYSACVAHFLYPSLPWPTCLSAGAAISTICAISKGRSIGTIAERNDSNEKKKKLREEARKKKEGLQELHVMHFRLKIKDGLALVGSEQKGKPGDEEHLRKKFGGGGQYEKVKRAFEECLETWRAQENELDGRAFGMYEEFRPDVSVGQKGWGRKGELRLGTVRRVVGR
ncbi:hypothetical protein CC78DRAFT_361206 [Lojkania enalia]|uniref:Uncharacterized protein n=1 Tax=Lojkania enalia TaxID=147567 RepID=A0A9P4K3H6_9PLEO|nr:hypothetical protein CC78DRAFT_361206 [Didymosphaeria enalia]